MTNYNNSIRFWSILSGLSLLVMAVAAGIAYGYIFPTFYVNGDPAATTAGIEADLPLYFSGAALWGLVVITDLIVTYGFYRFLSSIHKPLAIVSGIIRLIYSVVLGIAIIFLFNKDPDKFLSIWSAGLFIFGFHLIITGVAVLRSTVVLKILGVLLIIAGIGYSLISGIQNFFPEADTLAAAIETVMAAPMTIGELAFGIWLLVRGGKSLNQPVSTLPSQVAV